MSFTQPSTLCLVYCSLNDFVPITDPRKVAFTLVCDFDTLVFEEFWVDDIRLLSFMMRLVFADFG